MPNLGRDAFCDAVNQLVPARYAAPADETPATRQTLNSAACVAAAERGAAEPHMFPANGTWPFTTHVPASAVVSTGWEPPRSSDRRQANALPVTSLREGNPGLEAVARREKAPEGSCLPVIGSPRRNGFQPRDQPAKRALHGRSRRRSLVM